MFAPPLWAASIGQALAATAATERGLSSPEAAARAVCFATSPTRSC